MRLASARGCGSVPGCSTWRASRKEKNSAVVPGISIRRKLTWIIMAASTVAILLVSAGFVTYELFTYRQGMIRNLSTLADILGNRSTAALSFDNREDAEEDLSALRANND